MFAKIFPTIKHKITVIPNYVDSTEVLKKSLHNIDFSTDGIMILSVGRLSAEKGFNLAIEACRLLVDALPDIPFSWYVLGTGADEKKLSSLISFHGLEKKFYLLGENENPYPYMRMADIFVQPSYYEADSIVIHEAIILKKLIVATRTHSTARLINHLIDGIIVDISAKSIADGILLLLTDSEIKNTILTNIQNKQIDYSYYKQTLRKLFDL